MGIKTSIQSEEALEVVEILIICVAVIFVLLGTYALSFGDTADSRLATVLSLTRDGTWYIDRPAGQEPNLFERRTIDKVLVNGRMLSSKPPMLPLLMTAEYIAMKKVFGWDLLDDEDRRRVIRYMSMTLVGGAYLAALIFTMKTLRLFGVAPLGRVVMLFSLGFCTQLWGYGTNINNHGPAAGLLVVALYFALGLGSGKLDPKPWRFALFGLAGGLVTTMDMPGTVFVAFAGLHLLAKHPAKTLIWAVPAAAVPIGIQSAILWSITGSLLPVQMHAEAYLSEASYWRNPRGIDALNEPKGTYLFHMTFGRCGVFSLYPVLIAGLAGTLRAAFKRDTPWRSYVLAGFAAFAILTAYYAITTNNYGGEAYGFRWYIVAMPVLVLMSAPIFHTLRARWKWVFVGLLIGISFYSAWECSKSPWGANRQWTCRFLGPSYGRWK
ncbi:MAG TPA: hypothetical protein PLO37_01335 [Candidatus Hydrogenedentes bacterium]|nr:hypothetical protein [Candidatus Hydrogenedentota bacterium]HPG65459.1 hypothetical protein [Candidatus Hydrogenedentota bacterium]